MPNVLEVSNLVTQFYTSDGVTKAVNDVSFTVEEGETLAIVGESGSGKTVTSLSVLQLLPSRTGKIENGTVMFLGKNLLELSEKEMQSIRGNHISMIFQEPMTSLNPVFTIGFQLTEGLRKHKGLSRQEAFDRSVEMLKMVGIPDPEKRMKDYPHQLSGGMRQRVMIAMALSTDPELLIADEPTTALDVTIQAQILDLMRRLKKQTGTAIILITHDLGVVAEMADHVVVMYTGQIVEYGDVYSLFKEPLHPYTKGLISSVPNIKEEVDRLNAIRGMVPNLWEMPPGCSFCDRCDFATQICREKAPKIVSFDGRQVRCHLYREGGMYEREDSDKG